MRNFILLLYIFFATLNAYSQDSSDYLDSLKTVYSTMSDRDKAKIKVCQKIVAAVESTDSVYAWAGEMARLADIQNDDYWRASAYYNTSWADYYVDEYDSAIVHANKAKMYYDAYLKAIGENRADAILAFNINTILGAIYAVLQNYEISDVFYNEALDIANKLDNYYYLSEAYRHIGENYTFQGFYSGADSLLKLALHYDSLSVDENSFSDSYFRLCNLYMFQCKRNLSNVDTSLVMAAKKYMILAMENNDDDFFRYQLYYPLFESYFLEYKYCNRNAAYKLSLLDSIDRILYEGDRYITEYSVGNNEKLLITFGYIRCDIARRRFADARAKLDSISFSDLEPADIETMYLILGEYYEESGNSDSALYYNRKYYETLLENNSVDLAVKSTQNLVQSDFNDQIRKREAEEGRSRQRIMVVMILVLVLVIFFVFEYFRNRRHNKELNEKNTELAKSHKQITDSISYASLIQRAALPKDNELSALFNDYFLIYRPLNIVAGDFYWASQIGRWKILVCADCTGHGVPGAFVSMLGVSLLNEVTANVSADTKASDILNELRAKLMRALGQNKKKYDNGAVYSMDGMDLAMVMIDYDNMQMQFAGAYRPLWIWRAGQLIQYKPDKMPIGVYFGSEKSFTNHEIEIKTGDVLYMFSDGIPDQFGFTDDSHTTCKHFSTKQLAALITEIGGHQLQEQKQRIESEVDAWKNGYKQLDDNILIGIRI